MGWKTVLLIFILLPPLPTARATTPCKCQSQQPSKQDGGRSGLEEERIPPQLEPNPGNGNLQENNALHSPKFKAFRTPHFHHRAGGGSLLLGEMTEAFMGPRRKRRSTPEAWPLSIVYPVPQAQQNEKFPKDKTSENWKNPYPAGNENIPVAADQYSNSIQHGRPRKKNRPSGIQIFTASNQINLNWTEPEVIPDPNSSSVEGRAELGPIRPLNLQPQTPEDSALSDAWHHYGPNVRQIPHHGQFPSRRHGEDGWLQFQPMESEWSSRIGQPAREPIPEPTLFTRFLSRYIEFELTNYEWTDFGRKLGFAFALILVGVGWVALGISINMIPSTLFVAAASRRDLDLADDSIWGNSIVKTITENVQLALEGDWLRKLEEKVRSGGRGGGWLSTSVSCCILPNPKTLGTAECQVIRKGRKLSTFKCLSDLIYNFNFGPSPQK